MREAMKAILHGSQAQAMAALAVPEVVGQEMEVAGWANGPRWTETPPTRSSPTTTVDDRFARFYTN